MHARDFIRFPRTLADLAKAKAEFFERFQVPNVVGAIDCTHVRIVQPSQDTIQFLNRKGFYSLNVQAVCSATCEFIDVVALWPGCSHDAFIFSASALREGCDAGDLHGGFLLGDSGYGSATYLLTPYEVLDLPYKERYNYLHSRARITIERTFGQVKRKFYCLHTELRVNPTFASHITIACFALHNFSKRYRVEFDDDDDDDEDECDEEQEHRGRTYEDNDASAKQVRELYARRLSPQLLG